MTAHSYFRKRWRMFRVQHLGHTRPIDYQRQVSIAGLTDDSSTLLVVSLQRWVVVDTD